jgi:sugar phosphate isomerase/epimerase
MKTAITLSLLPASFRRPFVLGPELENGFATASELGFDAIELFPPTLESLDVNKIKRLVREFNLPVSTIGTGGGTVVHGLTLTDTDPLVRKRAADFAGEIIRRAAELDATAIIGSMQGRAAERPVAEVVEMFSVQLESLGRLADEHGQLLFLEPLNRYEGDFLNTLEDGSRLLESVSAGNLRILADLFHMNIEEADPAASLQRNMDHVGHVHFVDSNRCSAGMGHSDLKSIVEVLRQGNYSGYLAVEAFPRPDPLTAATRAAKAFQELGVSTFVGG